LSYDGVSAHLVDTLFLGHNWPKPAVSDGGVVYLGSPATTNNASATLQVWTVPNSGKFEQLEIVPLKTAPQQLKKINDLLVVQTDNVELFDARNPAELITAGSGNVSLCYGVLLDGADGEVGRGLWLPIGWYGVVKIPAGAGQ
jgi:hypothetical protein